MCEERARKDLTTNHDGEERKSWIPGGKCIEHDAGPAADDHGTKEWCPALPYQISDEVVPSHEDSTRYCGRYDEYRDDKGQCGVDPVDQDRADGP